MSHDEGQNAADNNRRQVFRTTWGGSAPILRQLKTPGPAIDVCFADLHPSRVAIFQNREANFGFRFLGVFCGNTSCPVVSYTNELVMVVTWSSATVSQHNNLTGVIRAVYSAIDPVAFPGMHCLHRKSSFCSDFSLPFVTIMALYGCLN